VPDPQYFNNRAAAYIMVKNFSAALADAQEALKKEPDNAKVSPAVAFPKTACRTPFPIPICASSCVGSFSCVPPAPL
jgi:hypothetical protein